MNKNPWEWNLDDLKVLIGQPESRRLEFKSSRLTEGNTNKLAEVISKEVSAFANTEGGTIIIGIEESKGRKPEVAEKFSGISSIKLDPFRIQQIIESNISPVLPGIRCKSIYLEDDCKEYVQVIFVPQGTTAYQAKDYKYYGRSEYECKPLGDLDVRLRMFRGKIPDACLEIRDLSSKEVLPKNGSFILSDGTYHTPASKDEIDKIFEYNLSLSLKNIGDKNIKSSNLV
jgi:hypothetical protein